MADKTWTDQPDVVTEAEIMFSFHENSRSVEIRKAREVYYVTVGNLFGSQTVFAADENVMWAVLRSTKSRKPKLPEGAEIVEQAA